MEIKKKRCHFCGKWYKPYIGAVKTQTACGKKKCCVARQRQNYNGWIQKHPCYSWGKARSWAKYYPDYWRQYRKSHPEYVERDNERRKRSLRNERCSAKQIGLSKLAEDKLRKIQELEPAGCSAKQIGLDRRVDEIINYLFWTVSKECSAKQIVNALSG